MDVPAILRSGAAFAVDVLSRLADAQASLAVLTVRLLFRGGVSVVRLELDAGAGAPGGTAGASPGGDPRRWCWCWELPFRAFVVQAARRDAADDSRLPRLEVPDALAKDLLYRLALAGAPEGQPLWLKLARPYGVLGTAPWEADLGAVLRRPVLRLPDFPERPAERANVLESAVIADACVREGTEDAVRRVDQVVQAVLAASSPRATARVHVFPSAWLHEPVRGLAVGRPVIVHDPVAAPTLREAAEAEEGGRKQPLRAAAWAAWIMRSLDGRCLDALHLVCHARWSEAGGGILITASPSPREGYATLTAVAPEELALLANRAGAWAVTFSPPSDRCARDVAFLADQFAHLRPGAVLFDPLPDAADRSSLDAAWRLLFSGKPAPPPVLDGGFLHCHPGFARGEREPDADEPGGLVEAQPPAWVGAMRRFLEAAVLDEAKRAAADVLLSSPRPDEARPREDAGDAVARATLAAMQEILDRHAAKK